MPDINKTRIAIVGLGYVGLPLAVEFGKQFSTIGFDIDAQRINELRHGRDRTHEVSSDELLQATQLQFTHNPNELTQCTVYIVTVPTPVDAQKRPDLRHLQNASELIGKLLKQDDVVIFESTVYPGATEEVCVPILAAQSGLQFNQDFYAAYSPERINPGDKEHRVADIVKVTSGSTPDIADFVDNLYRRVITAGTHKASSIRVAEAAKVIENTQRDVNIALINELAMIFNRLDIDTKEVLEAAASKWNFLKFSPGLVGGHCIGVDPYYLTHKAESIGYHPEMILAGRRINDAMGAYVASQVVKLMAQKSISIVHANVLIMGLTFKENCPDLRNTRVIDIITELRSYHAHIDVFDPHVEPTQAFAEYGITPIEQPPQNHYDAIIIAVPHAQFLTMSMADFKALGKANSVLFDVKSVLPQDSVDGQL